MQLGSLIGITSLIQLRDNTSCLLGGRLMLGGRSNKALMSSKASPMAWQHWGSCV
jgi:hypothetical protein